MTAQALKKTKVDSTQSSGGPDATSDLLRPTHMQVRLDALATNCRTMKARVSGNAKFMAVVKANAYGHGLVEAAQVFSESGADYLGVAFVEEGIELRRAGLKLPILVFGGIFGAQISLFIENDLELTASSVGKLDLIEERAKAIGRRAKVHLKVDTGMERIGVHYYNAEEFLTRAAELEHTDVVGVFSHLASAAEDHEFTREQFNRFKSAVVDRAEMFRDKRPMFHLSNSAGTMLYPEMHLDMVRCGVSLYGVYPRYGIETDVVLEPAMRLVSKVVYVKTVRAGAGIGYGQTWHAPKDTRIVTVPVGYGDGYFRSLSNKGEVLIGGKRFPIVGRVSMDQIMVDVGDEAVHNGDEVVLIGEQGNEKITAGEVATLAGSYSYEILTATNTRVPRVYG